MNKTREKKRLASSSDSIRCQVEGIDFEIEKKLLKKRLNGSLLVDANRCRSFLNEDKTHYVFDQSAAAFEILVYFICTGLLTRPINVSAEEFYSLLIFFRVDRKVIETFKKIEHLSTDSHWEQNERSKISWIHRLFDKPSSSPSKIVNAFFFAITLISYANLCIEYSLAPPLISQQSNFSRTKTIDLDFSTSMEQFFYLPELIYFIIIIIEFFCRYIYENDWRRFFRRPMIIIDLQTIVSCATYLLSMIFLVDLVNNQWIFRYLALSRLVRLLKLMRYSTFIRQYSQTIIEQSRIASLIFLIFIFLCIFFGNLMFSMTLMNRTTSSSNLLDSFYYAYETILTIGFGVDIPPAPYSDWITITSVLFGMLCLSLPVPFLAMYNLSLEKYERKTIS